MGSPDGETMRIIEYSIDYSDAIDIEYGKKMFDHQLLENYGHAGDIYARYLVTHYDEVKALYATVQQRIDSKLKLTQRERFWSATAAANIRVSTSPCIWACVTGTLLPSSSGRAR